MSKLKGKRIVKIVLLDMAGYIGAIGVFLLFSFIFRDEYTDNVINIIIEI